MVGHKSKASYRRDGCGAGPPKKIDPREFLPEVVNGALQTEAGAGLQKFLRWSKPGGVGRPAPVLSVRGLSVVKKAPNNLKECTISQCKIK